MATNCLASSSSTLVPLQEGEVPLQSPSPGWAGSHPAHALVDAYGQAWAIPAPRSEVGSEQCPLCSFTTGTLYRQQALEVYGLPDSVEYQITAQKDFLSPWALEGTCNACVCSCKTHSGAQLCPGCRLSLLHVGNTSFTDKLLPIMHWVPLRPFPSPLSCHGHLPCL